MRVSLSWLADYLGGDLPAPDALAEMLTMAGLEVEAVEKPGEALAAVVVGEIVERENHPNADRLSVCTVFDGREKHTVVCGAPNARKGLHSAFAAPGTTLPGGLLLEAREVRGVRSMGMLCSARELGLGDEHDGILDLGRRAKPGRPLAEALGLDDVILELGVTPNRPDALSHLGVAREVHALTALRLKEPRVRLAEAAGPVGEAARVSIEDPERCPRYVARVVEGVKIKRSPAWLVARLAAAGVRSLSNVVDVTNYVLMELGHPLHAFDLDRLGGNAIVVRRARMGEHLRTLDDVDRRLDPDDLVIADAERPVALAGVMGGGDSEVTGGTTRLLIESAYFAPAGIRRSAKRHGLHTEASHRFERGADPEVARLACDRAAALIAKLSGGKVREGVIDAYPRPVPPREVTLRFARTCEVLGLDIPAREQKRILRRLGFEVLRADRRALVLRPPSFRTEMDREVDVIEEVARIHGYGEIPARLPRRAPSVPAADPVAREDHVLARIREVLGAAGCHEAVNYSFVSPADVARTIPGDPDRPEARPIRLANPLTAEQSVMRTTLLTSLFSNLSSNRRFGENDLSLYEVGRAYLPNGDGGLREPGRVALVRSGRRASQSWATSDETVDFYDVKGAVEAILARLGIEGARFVHASEPAPWLHPRSAAEVRLGETLLGVLGEVHPVVAGAFDLPAGVFAAELELDALVAHAKLLPAFEDVTRHPAVLRDLAVVVDAGIAADRVQALLTRPTEVAGELGAEVTEATLFDVYAGPQVGEGRRSLAFAIRYQAGDRTLTDAEAGRIHDALVARLESELGAALRA